MTFGVEISKSEKVKQFLKDSNDRLLKGTKYLKSFDGGIEIFLETNKKLYYGVCMKPIFPPVYLVGVMGFIGVFVFSGKILTPVNIISLIFLLTGILYTDFYYYFMLRRGLKNKNINFKMRFLSSGKLIEKIIV